MVQVLVIEDSEVQIELISGMLRKHDASRFDISVARNLKEGLNLLSAKPFDVVLLDLTLPDSAGLESCIQLSQAASDVSIVVLTGMDDEELAVSTLQHGAEDYLVKGQITSQLLVRATRYAIERKKSRVELQRAHDELEIRVQERTAELQQMQEAAALHQDELAHASRLDTLGEMASGLAHELNQPLMAIIGFTDHTLYMMRNDQGDSERCIELIEDAGKEAKRAGEIIKRMRRLVTKRSSQRRSVNLNKAVTETVPLIRPGLHVEILLDLDEALPRVSIDRVQIQQVILNLARNAVQAMSSLDADHRELLLRTGTSDDMVFVEVADTGPGMSVEDLERLFDPFFSRKPDGLGLGLSISRTIVDAHGGRLTVKKNDLTGLTFRLTLPICNGKKPS
jgi:C4-dicarboxylate-specific signal transduction histidine kinase